MAKHQVVLAIQDTTELNYTSLNEVRSQKSEVRSQKSTHPSPLPLPGREVGDA
ncbi:MAG: hypothetical protein F6K17_22175 [Okeania sp. SIO3C4]|nr:hypothetical protein [Okeania sp. SIO3C4]